MSDYFNDRIYSTYMMWRITSRLKQKKESLGGTVFNTDVVEVCQSATSSSWYIYPTKQQIEDLVGVNKTHSWVTCHPRGSRDILVGHVSSSWHRLSFTQIATSWYIRHCLVTHGNVTRGIQYMVSCDTWHLRHIVLQSVMWWSRGVVINSLHCTSSRWTDKEDLNTEVTRSHCIYR